MVIWLDNQAPSLYHLIAVGEKRPTTASISSWENWRGVGSVPENCVEQGFDIGSNINGYSKLGTTNMAVGHRLKPLLILALNCIILNRSRLFDERLSNGVMPTYFYLSKVLSTPPIYKCIEQKVSRSRTVQQMMIQNSTKLARLLKLTNYGLLATYIILSGDISTNPGPFDLRASEKVKGISICHWNVQHLTESKFEEISLSLRSHQQAPNKVDVLILTETFCTSKIPDSFYKIEGYELYRKDRLHRNGGGILAFVNEQLYAKSRTDLMTNNTEIVASYCWCL